MPPSEVPVDKVLVRDRVDRVPVRDRVDIPFHRHVALQVDTVEDIHRQIYRPSVDMERTEHIHLLVRMAHSF